MYFSKKKAKLVKTFVDLFYLKFPTVTFYINPFCSVLSFGFNKGSYLELNESADQYPYFTIIKDDTTS